MIRLIEELEDKIIMYIDSTKKKDLDILFQMVIYRPSLKDFLELQNKILRFRNSKKLKELKEVLKSDYYIHYAKEDIDYFIDEYGRDIYKVIWRRQKANPVKLQNGQKLYHLAKKDRVSHILEEGLKPQIFSEDNVFYGHQKVFFSTKPILDENEKFIDAHLFDRVQLEIDYDTSYELFTDIEYSHIEGNPMVYALTDNPINISRISSIQPKPFAREKVTSP